MGMDRSSIWATLLLLTVAMGITFFVLNHEREPIKQSEPVKAAVIEDYIAEKYGDEFGWNIQNGHKSMAENALSLHPEAYESAKNAGVDFKAYRGEYINHYIFPLLPICQKDGEDRGVKLIVFEHNGKFFGDYMGSLNTDGGPRKTITKDEWLAEDYCK